MKTNYLKFIRTKVKKSFKGGGGNNTTAASAAKELVQSKEGKQTIDNANKLLKSEDGNELKGIAKGVLTGKEDINTAIKKGEGIVKKMAQSEEGKQINDVLNKVAPNNLAQSQEVKELVGMAQDTLGKTPQGAAALAVVDKASNIVGSVPGQKSLNDKDISANNKTDTKLADVSKEKSNKALLQLKKDFISNNNKLVKDFISNNNKSVSYPEYLQVLPLDNHMKHKLSSEFSTHIGNIKEKIDSARELINRQEEVNTDNQAILDQIRKEYVDQQQISDSKMEEKLSNYFKLALKALKAFGNAVVELINIIFNIIRIIVSFIRSPIGWAIITIIVFCIILSIILPMIPFLNNVIKDDKKNYNDKDKDKVECSNKFKMDGIEENWNWGNFMKNPAGYCLDKGLSGIKQNVKMPNALTNMYYNVFKPLGKGIENLSGNSIDKYKFNRPANSHQRTDSITNINYDLLSNNIQDKYSDSFKNKNNSITLLKPKDIKWEFPHLDYRNTDYSNIPESIKKYKDENDKDAYSLNDTKNINFKWELFEDEYIISCNSKFDNNVDTNLFKENHDYCESNTINLNKYMNE